MKEENEARRLEDLSIAELKVRLMLLDRIAKEALRAGDPRAEEPIRQQREINRVLVAKIQEERQRAGLPEPEPVSIGIRPVRMFGRRMN